MSKFYFLFSVTILIASVSGQCNVTGCLRCSTSNHCTICSSNSLGPNQDGSQCVCPIAGQAPTSSGHCADCPTGSAINSDQTACVCFNAGFILDPSKRSCICSTAGQAPNGAGTCADCPTGSAINSDQTACICSRAGFILNSAKTACVCPTAGQVPNDVGTCADCPTGSVVNSDQTSCVACSVAISNCSECSYASSAQKCSSCSPGFILTNNTCLFSSQIAFAFLVLVGAFLY